MLYHRFFYLTPNNTLMIESIVAGLRERSRGSEFMVVIYFNADLARPERAEQDKEIAADLVASGLEDMSDHFLPRRLPWCQDGRTWSMVRLGREVWYRTDYILETECSLFRKIFICHPNIM